ncbi:MAG: hypothetical protein SR1Q7_01180 [Quinella sp. 1Q7]|nr:hypothetical protein [Quinella sp. 1Q7]
MRVKDAYSLRTDELSEAVPTAENLPSLYDGGVVDEGIHRVKILVAENVAGDFLCA